MYKRVCVAGGDPAIVESPTEPKWSDEGKCNLDKFTPFVTLHVNQALRYLAVIYFHTSCRKLLKCLIS